MFESSDKKVASEISRTISLERIKEEASYDNLRYGIGRHDDAIYSQNEMIPRSSEPLQYFEKLAQAPEDLSAKGKEHAREMASEFFRHFDPNKDEIAILSSAITRARETAAIYLEVAEKMGFSIKIISSDDNTGSIKLVSYEEYERIEEKKKNMHQTRGQIPAELFERQGGSKIRTLKPLSLDNVKQMFVEFLFHPENYMDKVQNKYKNKIPPKYQEIWIEARKIIEDDNKGSWGQNFLAHSEKLQKLFDYYRQKNNLDEGTIPHFSSVKDMYQNNFRNILRLMARYDDVIDDYEKNNPQNKKVRVLGFSHENQLLYFLKKEFDKTDADKGRVIGFKILKDQAGKKHFAACLPDNPNEPREIDFPEQPIKR